MRLSVSPSYQIRRRAIATIVVAILAFANHGHALAAAGKDAHPKAAEYAQWVKEMKSAPRGPFARLRWFCADGSVHPPRPYPCKERGGGVQHGEHSKRTIAMRDDGFVVATVLADVDAEAELAHPDYRHRLAQVLVEKFLVQIDDGWILRRARFYRGALQEEDERAGARRLLIAMLADDRRVMREYALVRSAARLLPHGAETRSAGRVRQLSADLSDRDPDFLKLRNKIHVQPQASDAALVRAYAAKVSDADLKADYQRLAKDIDTLFSARSSAPALRALAKRTARHADVARAISTATDALEGATDDTSRFRHLAAVLVPLREHLTDISDGDLRLRMLDTSLLVETELFAVATRIVGTLAGASRRAQLDVAGAALDAVYGVGLLSARQRTALETTLARLAPTSVSLALYKSSLDQLTLVPAWASERLRFHFAPAMDTLAQLEPKSHRFIEDSLRGSPLFFFASVLDSLVRDANRLAGVRNELLGDTVGGGLRALNPGLARGTLLERPSTRGGFDAEAIYILPETESDLPPVAGILTAGEGNPLSHVQLLARNLGIPNVGVDETLLPRLSPVVGRKVLLAVTSAGSVQLAAYEPRHDALFAKRRRAEEQSLIRPDLEKLDLDQRRLLTLSDLRARDSGRTVGPKAAKLGELKHSYPDAVEEGLAIPFGVFRAMLERPYGSSGRSVFEWMRESYRALEALPEGSAERRERTDSFRQALYDWVRNAPTDPAFERELREAMQRVFGDDGSYGVFVRSDTNVEDLPGFTGAGLNLTVPHVVGVDAVLEAIPRVWASPFTARAFAWRQSHMDQPEHVYPAVLLLKSVNVDKSGVMVTQDIDSGSRDWLSLAVNEGVGGAVDGQAAESLRVSLDGEIRLMAQATSPKRRRLAERGGVQKIPASGGDYVLERAEVAQLIDLTRSLPQRFPAIVDASGNAAPADIEFGFLGGKLKLFQIRPFLESRKARSNAYLNALDADLKDLGNITVNLSEATQ